MKILPVGAKLFHLWGRTNGQTKFLDGLSKNIQIPNFIKIRPVGAELFHKRGRKDGGT